MRVKANVLSAPSVVEDLGYYKDGKAELRSIEALLEQEPLYGTEFCREIPAIRWFSRSFAGTVLNYFYLFLPCADFIPRSAIDEILLFKMSGPEMKPNRFFYLSPHQKQEFVELLVEIYQTAKDTV
jgi:hypothetical protein